MVQRRRAKQGHDAPCLRRFSAAFRGRTYRRSRKETRGRKRTFTKEWVQKLDRTRKKLQRAAQGEREVRWEDVRRASRAPKAHRSTLMRAFEREGVSVRARPPRSKPDRTPQQANTRLEYCAAWCVRGTGRRLRKCMDRLYRILLLVALKSMCLGGRPAPVTNPVTNHFIPVTNSVTNPVTNPVTNLKPICFCTYLSMCVCV